MTRSTFSYHLTKRPKLKKAYIKEVKEVREKFVKLIKDNPLKTGRPKKVTKSKKEFKLKNEYENYNQKNQVIANKTK